MHEHLIKWLSEIIQKEKGVPQTLTPRRCCLDFANYSKVYNDVTERRLLA